jgi:hypothetical protein
MRREIRVKHQILYFLGDYDSKLVSKIQLSLFTRLPVLAQYVQKASLCMFGAVFQQRVKEAQKC